MQVNRLVGVSQLWADVKDEWKLGGLSRPPLAMGINVTIKGKPWDLGLVTLPSPTIPQVSMTQESLSKA